MKLLLCGIHTTFVFVNNLLRIGQSRAITYAPDHVSDQNTEGSQQQRNQERPKITQSTTNTQGGNDQAQENID
ncbi:MAG: hypothetical protein IPG23_06925 [Burkholderiales bacterium]|nr:hypothetical protein [Burkholderiales bacterium]